MNVYDGVVYHTEIRHVLVVVLLCSTLYSTLYSTSCHTYLIYALWAESCTVVL